MASGLTVLFLGVGVVLLYLLPAIVASLRKQENKNSVFILNLFLGWTFLGWVIALAMAVGGSKATAAN